MQEQTETASNRSDKGLKLVLVDGRMELRTLDGGVPPEIDARPPRAPAQADPDMAAMRAQVRRPGRRRRRETPAPKGPFTIAERIILTSIASREAATYDMIAGDLYDDTYRPADPNRSIQVMVHRLKRKVKPYGVRIKNWREQGYAMEPESRAALRVMMSGVLNAPDLPAG
jgi:hypothetical protein